MIQEWIEDWKLRTNFHSYGDVDETDSGSVYWKVLANRGGLITIAEMQWFDEDDYNHKQFLKDEDGTEPRFPTEECAAEFINEKFGQKYIDPEYVSPNNQSFWKDAERGS